MKIDRLVGIIMVLLDEDRIGAQQLADMFEVSPRTIYRDIDTISMAGIPIRSTPGVGGGFEIMQEYKVDRNIFSPADLSVILMGLTNLSAVIRRNELVSALAKVKHFIPDAQAKDIELKAGQVWIDPGTWFGTVNTQKNLELIQTALQEHRRISFEYIAHHGIRTTRAAEPYQLVLKSGHWYVQSYCHMRHDFRLFRLSRMSNLQIEPEVFAPRDPQRPILDAAALLEPMQTEIKLRIHSAILDRVLDHCTLEHCLPDGEEHYVVRFPFIENDYYYDILLSFGDKCECLEPLSIRSEMERRVHNIAAIYAK